MFKRSVNIIFAIITIIFFSCKKEYSYEGGNTTIIVDTGTTNIPRPYICPSCIGSDNFIEGKWSFYNGSDFYCGSIDTAIAAPARNGFTFFWTFRMFNG